MVVLVVGGIFGLRIAIGLKNVIEELPDAYAIWGTGELIIAYIEEKNEMPESWMDLEPFWDAGAGMHAKAGGIESFEDLQSVVEVKFDRLNEFRLSASEGIEPPPLVTAKSGATTRWEGADAGEMIIYHLKNEWTPVGR